MQQQTCRPSLNQHNATDRNRHDQGSFCRARTCSAQADNTLFKTGVPPGVHAVPQAEAGYEMAGSGGATSGSGGLGAAPQEERVAGPPSSFTVVPPRNASQKGSPYYMALPEMWARPARRLRSRDARSTRRVHIVTIWLCGFAGATPVQVLNALAQGEPRADGSPLDKLCSRILAARRRLPQPTLAEADSFLQDTEGDVDRAIADYRSKQVWRSERGRITIGKVGSFYLSEGYSVCLEGCVDRAGQPLVFANGMPHGSADEVVDQTIYTYERAMAQCAKRKLPLKCTTLCNVLNPTFRFPDSSIKASIRVAKLYYPWHAHGSTVFVGMPAPVQWVFKLCRPFMSKQQYESVRFARANDASLWQYVTQENAPRELGGTAQWNARDYVRQRATAEGVLAPTKPRAYRGKRLDVEEFQALESS